jgi:hypothetical protein
MTTFAGIRRRGGDMHRKPYFGSIYDSTIGDFAQRVTVRRSRRTLKAIERQALVARLFAEAAATSEARRAGYALEAL